MPTRLEEEEGAETIPCPTCRSSLSTEATWCSHCHRPIITQRRAKFFIGIGIVLTLLLTYDAARATLAPQHQLVLITLYLTFALLSAFGTYISYGFLRYRRLLLAAHGIRQQT